MEENTIEDQFEREDGTREYDVFISYSRKNKDVVLPIKKELERLGFTCWIDLSDIPCGAESFKKKVISGIKQTRIALLFFLSAESQSSEYALREVNFAKKRAMKRVILIRFNDDQMTDDFYFDYQDADIIDWRIPEQKGKLLRNLKNWASQRQPLSDQVSPAPADGPVEIYVGNLSYDMTEDQLRKEFEAFGTVNSAHLIVNKFNGKSKGFGFVQMPDRAEAEMAVAALNDKEILGRRMKCSESKNLI